MLPYRLCFSLAGPDVVQLQVYAKEYDGYVTITPLLDRNMQD